MWKRHKKFNNNLTKYSHALSTSKEANVTRNAYYLNVSAAYFEKVISAVPAALSHQLIP